MGESDKDSIVQTDQVIRVTVDIPWLDKAIEYEFNGDTGKMTVEIVKPAEPRTATVSATVTECYWPKNG